MYKSSLEHKQEALSTESHKVKQFPGVIIYSVFSSWDEKSVLCYSFAYVLDMFRT